MSVRIIPRDIQSRMDERSSRIWKLHHLVLRLTKLPARLEPSATSMCIICMFGVWLCFSCIVHWCYIFRYCRIGGCVVLLFLLIFPAIYLFGHSHLVGRCCCFSSVKDQKVVAIECFKRCCPLLLPHIPCSSGGIVCTNCCYSILGDCWYKTKCRCWKVQKNQH